MQSERGFTPGVRATRVQQVIEEHDFDIFD
jgi:hypothetical protein